MNDPDGASPGMLVLWALVLLAVVVIILVLIALILIQPRY
jgi:hypothetical protein